jgi:hypothetical protein
MDDFPGNSRKPDPEKVKPRPKEEKKVERVTTSEPVRRKKPLGRRFADMFGGKNAKGVWSYVALDVLIPAAKDMIVDAITTGAERTFYQDSRPRGRRGGYRQSGGSGFVSYDRFSQDRSRNTREEPRNISRRSRASHDFDEIILATRVEAEEVIERLFDLVGKYEAATVADLYDLVGIEGNYTDDKWGWTDMRGAGVTRAGRGYLLDLPKPESLD